LAFLAISFTNPFFNINPFDKSKRMLEKIHPSTDNRAEGFIHLAEQEKEIGATRYRSQATAIQYYLVIGLLRVESSKLKAESSKLKAESSKLKASAYEEGIDN